MGSISARISWRHYSWGHPVGEGPLFNLGLSSIYTNRTPKLKYHFAHSRYNHFRFSRETAHSGRGKGHLRTSSGFHWRYYSSSLPIPSAEIPPNCRTSGGFAFKPSRCTRRRSLFRLRQKQTISRDATFTLNRSSTEFVPMRSGKSAVLG